ncbi:hypothetical protein HII31_06612 [Pseudocercospora fuligena]|uniref:Transmembrane protein n=1 Tax=Pseudocercospora fuligena TaxID=685502 RepID=A0A8H6VIT8_9PEZI|nr:hypothetical protein HII31_06612 [Pseudocercospora fuligena]
MEFVGCCITNPCGAGCNASDLLPAQMISGFGTVPDEECSDGFFYTCAMNIVQFWGCCRVNPCASEGCPGPYLAQAFLSGNPELAADFIAMNDTIETAKSRRLELAQSGTHNGLQGNPPNGVGFLPPQPTGGSTGTDSSMGAGSSTNLAALLGGILGAVVILVCAIALYLFARRRRRRHGKVPTLKVATEHKRPETLGIFWRAPTLIVFSFLVGLILAIGHHLLYASLDGQIASDGRYNIAGWNVSRQQLATSGGTALAFLVKAALVFCVSTAYAQILWRALTRAEYPIESLDNMFAALQDLVAAASTFKIYRVPLLSILTTISWLLPIASIIAPAALTVTFDRVPTPPVKMLSVPLPAFESFSFASWRTTASVQSPQQSISVSGIQYQSPNQEVLRVANAAAAGGTILSISPPAANASWSVSFDGPTLHCEALTEHSSLKQNLQQTLNGTLGPDVSNSTCLDAESMFTYLAWQQNGTDAVQAFDAGELRIDNIVMGDLFVAILPSAAQPIIQNERCVHGMQPFSDQGMDTFFENATILQCSFGKSLYRLAFDYVGTTGQHINITMTTREKRLEPPVTDLLQAAVSSQDHFALQPLTNESPAFPSNSTTTSDIDGEILGQWSYEAVAAAFKSILLGGIGRGSLDAATLTTRSGNSSTTRYYRSSVYSSSLSQAKELAALAPGPPSAYGLTAKMRNSRGYAEAWSMLPRQDNSTGKQNLKAVLEELFRNITVSMLSSDLLQSNGSKPLTSQQVAVTFNNYANLFVYSPGKLWLAYGIALGSALICAIIGLLAIFSTGASYTTSFSTILRVVRQARLATDVAQEDKPGKDPLPAELAKTSFRMRPGADDTMPSSSKGEYSKVAQVVDGEVGSDSSSDLRAEMTHDRVTD